MSVAIDSGYRDAEFVSILDGDTFVARVVALKLKSERVLHELHVRVRGWNAAELSEPDGPFMRDRFETLLRNAKTIVIKPQSRSFERIVCDVYIDGELFAGILQVTLQRRRMNRAEHSGDTR